MTWLTRALREELGLDVGARQTARRRSDGRAAQSLQIALLRPRLASVAGAVTLRNEPPGGVSPRCLHAEASRRAEGRAFLTSTIAAERRARTCLGGGHPRGMHHPAPASRGGRCGLAGASRGDDRALRRTRHEDEPATTGCQRNTRKNERAAVERALSWTVNLSAREGFQVFSLTADRVAEIGRAHV